MSICIVGTPKRHMDVGAGTVAVCYIPMYSYLRLSSFARMRIPYPFWLKNELSVPSSLLRAHLAKMLACRSDPEEVAVSHRQKGYACIYIYPDENTE